MATAAALKVVSEPTNGGQHDIDLSQPYRVSVVINGHADLLFHRWNSDAVEAKAKAAKGSAAKKTDAIETYVWRNDAGDLCLPGEYLRGSIVAAAKFHQDPRSPRKSAMDLFKAGVVSLTDLASLGAKAWEACLSCSTTFPLGKLKINGGKEPRAPGNDHGLNCPNCRSMNIHPADGSTQMLAAYHGERGTLQ